jgi:DNA-binding SARP family transcriptional activator
MKYQLIGPLEVVTNDGERLSVDRPKHAHLLAILLLSASVPMSIDRLVSELWQDRPPASADRNLKT